MKTSTSEFYSQLKHLRTSFMAKCGKRITSTPFSIGDVLIYRPKLVKFCIITLTPTQGIIYSLRKPRKTLQIKEVNVKALYKKYKKSARLKQIPTDKEEVRPLFNKTLKLQFLLKYYPLDIPDRIKLLSDTIEEAREAYYSGHKTSPLTDTEYDTMMDMLEAIDPSNPQLSKTGARETPTESSPKVKLPVRMPSLTKIKPGDGSVSKWVRSLPVDSDDKVVVSTKLDGMSMLATYQRGRFNKALTRGDGEVGSDITAKAKYINSIPKTLAVKKNLLVRGELILSAKVFDKYFSKDFANARNLVASIRTADNPSKFLLDKVDFIAYSIVNSNLPKTKQFQILRKLGFKVPDYKVIRVRQVSDKNLSTLDKVLRTDQSDYAADGLVVELDDTRIAKNLGTDAKNNPKAARAFKPPTQAKETTVDHVEWNVTKEGYLNPTVVIEPVELAGVMVSRAAGKNAKNIKKLGIGPGAVVSITRAGDVIPDILSTIKPVKPNLPTKCPRCETKLVWVR